MEALDYIVAVRLWRRLPWNLGASSQHRKLFDEHTAFPTELAAAA
ncbi:hypothetical protein OG568_52985 (plasmid) [Streptomyces sp. NBC_01450]|nr:hypothetical protein [Streptomyces sp. NBC_01450]